MLQGDWIQRPGFNRTFRQAMLLAVLLSAPPALAGTGGPMASPDTPSVVPAGTLEVTSEAPGATVTLDGVETGVTPLTLESVKPGSHTVRAEGQGRPAQFRTVIMPEGGSLILHFSDANGWSTTTEPVAGDPGKDSVRQAAKALGRSVLLGTPWLAFLVVPAIFTSILALLAWTTPASEAPFAAQGLHPSDGQWGAVRAVTLASALMLGGLALGCVVLAVIFPFSRLLDVAEAVQAQKAG